MYQWSEAIIRALIQIEAEIALGTSLEKMQAKWSTGGPRSRTTRVSDPKNLTVLTLPCPTDCPSTQLGLSAAAVAIPPPPPLRIRSHFCGDGKTDGQKPRTLCRENSPTNLGFPLCYTEMRPAHGPVWEDVLITNDAPVSH